MQNVGQSLNELCPAEFHSCVVVEGLGAKDTLGSAHCPLSAKVGHEHHRRFLWTDLSPFHESAEVSTMAPLRASHTHDSPLKKPYGDFVCG